MQNRYFKSVWNFVWSLMNMSLTLSLVMFDIYTKSNTPVVSGFVAGIGLILVVSCTADLIGVLRENAKKNAQFEIVEEDHV